MFNLTTTEDIVHIEKMFLSMKKITLLHQWINALSKISNDRAMSITEKAKYTTLASVVESLELNKNPNLKLTKIYCLSLVRKEVAKQRRNNFAKAFGN